MFPVLLFLCWVFCTKFVLAVAPHNDASCFTTACYSGLKLSTHLSPFTPNETFTTSTSKELIIASANSQVLPLALNLLKFIRALDLTPDDGRQLRFLLVVFDPEALTLCEELNLPCFYPKKQFSHMNIQHLDKSYMAYGDKHFKRITLSLTRIIGSFLREGWTVFNTDVDIAWLKSPYDAPTDILSYNDKHDIAIGGNNRPYFKATRDINTGYYRVKPTEWSVSFFERMFQECEHRDVDDQDCMKKMLSEGGEAAMAHLAFLNTTDYPTSGCVWKKMTSNDRKNRAHLFHAACMSGMAEKLGFMNDFGMLRCSKLKANWINTEAKGLFTNEDGKKALNLTLQQIRAEMNTISLSKLGATYSALDIC